MKKPPDFRPEHDGSYKRMFSHAPLMESLLRRFIAKNWADTLDFSTLELVKSHFVGPENRKRDGDLVWRLERVEGGGWFYVYVQLEFQSTPDRFMALRALTYLCLLYEDLVVQKELSETGMLPPVLPVVLYNGKEPWGKPLEVAELVEEVPEELRDYLPRFKYLLVDEGRLRAEELGPVDNPVSAIFSLEQAKTGEDLHRGLRAVIETTDRPDLEKMQKDVLSWVVRSLLPARFPGSPIVELSDLLETPQMLAETAKEWPSKWLEEGRKLGLEEGLEKGLEEGLEKGHERGRAEGLRHMIELQLKLKFGEVASSYAEQIERADEQALLLWVTRLLSASRIEDVFEGASESAETMTENGP